MSYPTTYLKSLLMEEKDYSLDELKEALQLKSDKNLCTTLKRLLEESVSELDFNSAVDLNSFILKIVQLLPSFFYEKSKSNPEVILGTIDKVKNILKVDKSKLMGEKDKNRRWITFIDSLMIRIDYVCSCLENVKEKKPSDKGYAFFETLICDNQDINLIREIVKCFPKIVNVKDGEKIPLFEHLVSYYMDQLKALGTDNINEILYLDSVIDEILDSPKANFENIKDELILNINRTLEGLKKNDRSRQENKRPRYFLEKLRSRLQNNISIEDRFDNLNRKYGKSVYFSKEIFDEIASIKGRISQTINLSNLYTITIDPSYAKDRDDALSLEILGNGEYYIYVHTTDADRYIIPGSAVDLEAFRRGQALYLTKQTIPMLPVEVRRICSLDQGTTKNALTFRLKINDKGEVEDDYKFFESTIYVNRRLSYKEADGILEKGNMQDSLFIMLNTLKTLSNGLGKKSDQRESYMALEDILDEMKLNENEANIEEIEEKRSASQKIVREFVTLANYRIAKTCYEMKIPFLNRVHKIPSNLAHVISDVKGAKEFFESQRVDGNLIQVLERTMLTSLVNSAYYSRTDIGHDGLGLPYYSHFSAPMRRYSGIFCARLAKRALINRVKDSEIYASEELIDIVAERLNENRRQNDAYVSEYNKLANVSVLVKK